MDPEKGKTSISYDRRPQHPVQVLPAADPPWSSPPNGWVKLNADGSYSDGAAGAGMVLRDDQANIIFSACRSLYACRDALEAELCACMEGISFAIQRSDSPVVIELDSLVAVKMIQGRDQDRSLYASLVNEIRYLLTLRGNCITHIRRSQNKVSDSLANFARREGRTMTWIGSGPSCALELAAADCNSTML